MTDLQPPFSLFRDVWARAERAAPAGADHCVTVLATADGAGRPSARVVLLRGFDEEGFVFYTNYASRKALQLEASPRAALCFYWHWLEEQVRVEGDVVRVTREESDAYFASRPRGSQIGAWASKQSQPLTSRSELEARYHELSRQFADGPVPRPEFWGGYRLFPDRIEFWKAGEFRLHDRLAFSRTADGWVESRLYP
jgi:pyridoxamine 5'-phosphate oxidase